MLLSILRQIVRPSDRGIVRPYRRIIRRSAIVILGLATLLAVGMWVVSYTGFSPDYTWQFDQGWLRVFSSDGQPYIGFEFGGPSPYRHSYLSIGAAEGQAGVYYMCRIAKGTIVRRHDFELGGFCWRQWSNSTVLQSGVGPFEEGNPATTDDLRRILQSPCWALVLVFSAWPIIAFIRGPYRRAAQHRKMLGLCVRCSYNLTGNLSGVCPECGTPIKYPGTPQ